MHVELGPNVVSGRCLVQNVQYRQSKRRRNILKGEKVGGAREKDNQSPLVTFQEHAKQQ